MSCDLFHCSYICISDRSRTEFERAKIKLTGPFDPVGPSAFILRRETRNFQKHTNAFSGRCSQDCFALFACYQLVDNCSTGS